MQPLRHPAFRGHQNVTRRARARKIPSFTTVEVTQGQILSQSHKDATRLWWHLYGIRLKTPSICPLVASRVEDVRLRGKAEIWGALQAASLSQRSRTHTHTHTHKHTRTLLHTIPHTDTLSFRVHHVTRQTVSLPAHPPPRVYLDTPYPKPQSPKPNSQVSNPKPEPQNPKRNPIRPTSRDLDLIAASIYDDGSVGSSIRPSYAR